MLTKHTSGFFKDFLLQWKRGEMFDLSRQLSWEDFLAGWSNVKGFSPAETPASSNSRIPAGSLVYTRFQQSNPQAAAAAVAQPCPAPGSTDKVLSLLCLWERPQTPLGLLLSLGQPRDYDPFVHGANTSSLCFLEKLHFSAAPLLAVMEGSWDT